jgi:hypothetical protein
VDVFTPASRQQQAYIKEIYEYIGQADNKSYIGKWSRKDISQTIETLKQTHPHLFFPIHITNCFEYTNIVQGDDYIVYKQKHKNKR